MRVNLVYQITSRGVKSVLNPISKLSLKIGKLAYYIKYQSGQDTKYRNSKTQNWECQKNQILA